MLLLGIAATNSVTEKEDNGHNIKQAVNCMGPELLLNNAPAPPASNFVHFFIKSCEIQPYIELGFMQKISENYDT